jgi:hypothetical protein
MLYLTAESESAGLLPTRTGRMSVPSDKYGMFEYGGLPVNRSVIMLSHNISHPPRRVGHAGQQVKAAANWSSRLPWVPVRHGQWRVAVVASQVEHVSITIV